MLPPMESTWRAILGGAVLGAFEDHVLKEMGDAVPFGIFVTKPVCGQIPWAERMCCICSVMTVRPLGSFCRRILRTSLVIEFCI